MYGNKALAVRSLPLQEGGALLRIVQRMRLEASQLESVARRMTVRFLFVSHYATFLEPKVIHYVVVFADEFMNSLILKIKMAAELPSVTNRLSQIFNPFFCIRVTVSSACCWPCLVGVTKTMSGAKPSSSEHLS